MKMLRNDIIREIADMKIDSSMSVSTLHALEIIYRLRLMLAKALHDEHEQEIENICRGSLDQIGGVINEKYETAGTFNEKIEMLECLEEISLFLNNDHSPLALEEAGMLEDTADLTNSQRLRLAWIPGIDAANPSAIARLLLAQAASAFDMATLALIRDFCEPVERQAIDDCYAAMLSAAIARNDTPEVGSLLALSASWCTDATACQRLAQLAMRAASVPGLSMPEQLVFPAVEEVTANFARLNI